MDSDLPDRKTDHLKVNLTRDVRSGIKSGLDNYRFIHNALPEIDYETINTSTHLFNHRLKSPLLISSMTGGTLDARLINLNLAKAAQFGGFAMGVGSLRIAIENPELADTFRVRKEAPDIFLFANLGAVQLNYGFSIEHCRIAVEMIEADALILHLNPLQEALQSDGNCNFSGLLKKIEMICRSISLPVVIKEVGWGISGETAKRLLEAGVSALDVAGAGGTSWSQVEMNRMVRKVDQQVAAAFVNWGIPTAESILQICKFTKDIPIIASGGLKDGVDLAKCLALGASLGGFAGAFLKAAAISAEVCVELFEVIDRQLRISMFVTGSRSLKDLLKGKLVKIGSVNE